MCTDKGRDRLIRQLNKFEEDKGLFYEYALDEDLQPTFLLAYEVLDTANSLRIPASGIVFSKSTLPARHGARSGLGGDRRPLAAMLASVSVFYQFHCAFGRLGDKKRWRVYSDAGLSGSLSRDCRKAGRVSFRGTYKKAFGPGSSRIIRSATSLKSRKADLVQLADVVSGCCDLL